MARLKEIVIDANDPAALARFWPSVLDGFEIRPCDRDEIDRLAAMGRSPETDPSVAVDGLGLTIFFRESSRPKNERGRIHLDIAGDSRAAEVERVTRLGATTKAVRNEYTVMLDPEGNEFGIQDPTPPLDLQAEKEGDTRRAVPGR